MYDITNGLTSVLNLIISGITFAFSYLDSFVFNGVSLLDYIIAISILGVAVTVFVSTLSSGMNRSERYMKKEKFKAWKKANNIED